MNLLARLILAIAFTVLLSPVSVAENKQEEGENLIRRVEQVSNIRSADAHPFHLKASFALLGNSAAAGEGTYIEIWASQGRWRRETVLAAFHRTEVGREKTRWTVDSTEEVPGKAGQLGALLQLRDVRQGPIKVAAIRDQTVEGVQARCVELKDNGIGKETLCIDAQSGVLLLKKTPTLWMGKKLEYSCQYGQYQEFAGRMYPRHIQCGEDGHPAIDVRVVELFGEPSPDSALFVPPIDAKELANCPGGVQAPKALQTPDPEYPKNEPQPISPVAIWLVVGVNGKPRDLKVVRSVGKAFDDRALAAVSQWVFKPAMCEGDPVAVEVNVEVAFRKW